MPLRASILIAAHNEGPCLRKTVMSVLDASFSLDAEIIIADDASTDYVPDDLAHEFPGVRLVRHPERRGASPTKHLAATEARGEVLVFLDGHTHPEPGPSGVWWKTWNRRLATPLLHRRYRTLMSRAGRIPARRSGMVMP